MCESDCDRPPLTPAQIEAGADAVYAILFALDSDGVQWPRMQHQILAERVFSVMANAAKMH
jgi:hypothetical protein